MVRFLFQKDSFGSRVEDDFNEGDGNREISQKVMVMFYVRVEEGLS